MNEFAKIVLTSSLTIIGGVIIYVFGQIISKFFIDPIHRQGEIIGDVADALIFHARAHSSPGRLKKELSDEASKRFRELASLLRSRSYVIKFYGFFEKIKIVRKLDEIEEASSQLIGLSNSLHNPETDKGSENYERVQKIRKALGIPFTD